MVRRAADRVGTGSRRLGISHLADGWDEGMICLRREDSGEGGACPSVSTAVRKLVFFTIVIKNVVNFTPFKDGIGLFRDAANAKPQNFQTGAGWFTYNLITNLARPKVPEAK